MHFAAPHWIAAGLLFCLLYIAGWYWLQAKRQHALQSFAAPGLLKALTGNVSRRKRRLKLSLQVLALFSCFVALARPQYGHHWVDVKQKGIDILFALDTSSSMLVEDMLPNRLKRAKFAILDFIGQLEGDRVGLLPFAGSAFLFCPLTTDYHAFEQSLTTIDTRIIPNQGTNLARAITTAGEKLRNDANHKLLILITDGESLQGNSARAAAAAAREKMTIFTVGVGTGEGELIPVYRDGAREFVKDQDGRFVRSRLDETTLREIAEITDGLYVPLGNQGQGLATIHKEKLARIPKAQLNEKRKKVPIERFPWFLGLALVLLIADYLTSSRKNGKVSLRFPGMIRSRFFPLLAIGVFSLLPFSTELYASPGEEAFQKRDYKAAHQYYQEALKKNGDNPELLFNSGTTAYKTGRFEEAVTAFNRALHSDDLNLQEKAYYNLGNAYFRQGEQETGKNPQKTISHWQDALKAFEAALQLNSDNQRAEHNRNLVKAKLEQLRNKQQQGQGQDQQQDQSRKNDQRQDQSDGDTGKKEGTQSPDTGKSMPPSPQENENNQPGHNGKKENSEGQTAPSQDDGNNQSPFPDRPEKKDLQGQADSSKQRDKAMTKEEAHQLLDEMKSKDEILNFIPHGSEKPSTDGRNW